MNALYQLFPELTSKQFSILEQYACGLTTEEIATRNLITRDAVNRTLKAVRDKYNSTSSNDLRFIYLSRVFNSFAKYVIKINSK